MGLIAPYRELGTFSGGTAFSYFSVNSGVSVMGNFYSSGITTQYMHIRPQYSISERPRTEIIYTDRIKYKTKIIYKDRVVSGQTIYVDKPITIIKEVQVMDYTSLSWIGATLVVCFIYDKFIRPRLTIRNAVKVIFRVIIWPFKKVIKEIQKAEEEITSEK